MSGRKRKRLQMILNIQSRPLKRAGKSAWNLLPAKRRRLYIKKIIACRRAISVYSKNNQNSYCFLKGRLYIFKKALFEPREYYCVFQGDVRIFKKIHAKEQAVVTAVNALVENKDELIAT